MAGLDKFDRRYARLSTGVTPLIELVEIKDRVVGLTPTRTAVTSLRDAPEPAGVGPARPAF